MSTTAETTLEISPAFDAECLVDTVTQVSSPFIVLRDTREQMKYGFPGLRSDKVDGSRIIQVRVKDIALKAGDYSLEIDGVDCSNQISIERKTFEDTFGTLGSGRARFIRELEKLSRLQYAAIVIESSFSGTAKYTPLHSRMSSKTVIRSLIAFSMRYNVHIWFADDRRMAEGLTYRILERFYKDHVNSQETAEKAEEK